MCTSVPSMKYTRQRNVMRERSTPRNGSSSRENKSLPSGSRSARAAVRLMSVPVDGDAHRPSTPVAQRSCATRAAEGRSAEEDGPKPCVAASVTASAITAAARVAPIAADQSGRVSEPTVNPLSSEPSAVSHRAPLAVHVEGVAATTVVMSARNDGKSVIW